MRQETIELVVETRGQGLHDCTDAVRRWVDGTGFEAGLLTIFIRHTSASLLIQENAAPAARRDLERYFARIAPESREYEHDDEGPDDMPAHLRAVLTGVNLSIPVQRGRMLLGTWQGIYLAEHRRDAHRREVAMHLFGD